MALNAKELDKSLKVKVTGDERVKFIMAAYNAGMYTVRATQAQAIEMGRDGTTWESLVDGDKELPLHKALKEDKTLQKTYKGWEYKNTRKSSRTFTTFLRA